MKPAIGICIGNLGARLICEKAAELIGLAAPEISKECYVGIVSRNTEIFDFYFARTRHYNFALTNKLAKIKDYVKLYG